MHILKARDEELGTKPIFQKNRGGFFRRKTLPRHCDDFLSCVSRADSRQKAPYLLQGLWRKNQVVLYFKCDLKGVCRLPQNQLSYPSVCHRFCKLTGSFCLLLLQVLGNAERYAVTVPCDRNCLISQTTIPPSSHLYNPMNPCLLQKLHNSPCTAEIDILKMISRVQLIFAGNPQAPKIAKQLFRIFLHGF